MPFYKLPGMSSPLQAGATLMAPVLPTSMFTEGAGPATALDNLLQGSRAVLRQGAGHTPVAHAQEAPPPAETTQLNPLEEEMFRRWADKNAPGWTESDNFYDTRGLWKQDQNKQFQPVEHATDQFKQHGHPTFSRESQYSRGPNDGGMWRDDTSDGGSDYMPALALSHKAPYSGGIPGDQLFRAILEKLGPPR